MSFGMALGIAQLVDGDTIDLDCWTTKLRERPQGGGEGLS